MKRYLSLATILLLAATPSSAQMTASYLTVDAEPGAPFTFGYGYDSRAKNGEFKKECVEFLSTEEHNGSRMGSDHVNYKLIENNYEIVKDAQMSIKSSIKATYGAGSASLKNKTDLLKKTKASTYNLTIFAYALYYDEPRIRYIKNVKLKEKYRNLLNDPKGKVAFKNQCGDGFIIGIQTGKEFLGTATVKTQTLQQSTKLASWTGLGVKYTQYEGKADVNLTDAIESIFGSNNFNFNVYQTGGSYEKPTDLKSFKRMYENFGKEGRSSIVRYIILPYTFLDDYPYQDPFTTDIESEALAYLAEAIWDLSAAIEDAQMVINTPHELGQSLFALGTTTEIRNQRIDAIKRYRNAWQKERDLLIKAAKKCDTDFNRECLKLANLYRNRKISSISYQVLPERYLDDCYSPIKIDVKSLPTFSSAFAPMKADFDMLAGDGETGGNPVRVTAIFNVEAENGDPKGKLIATLSIARTEWKGKQKIKRVIKYRDGRTRTQIAMPPLAAHNKRINRGDSVFAKMVRFPIFQFENEGMIERSYKTCQWRDPKHPIKADLIKIPFPVLINTLKAYGFDKRYVYGLVDSYSKHNARGQAYYGPGKGVLKSVRCEVDRKGRNDNLAGCEDVEIATLTLDLVSTQDVTADKWEDPHLDQVPKELVEFVNGKPLKITPLRLDVKPMYQMPSSDKLLIKKKLQLKINKKNFQPKFQIKLN
jgi:hypothetical protein